MKKKRKKVKVIDKKLGREKLHGQVWGYMDDNPLIEIDPRLKSKERLIILVHEAMHVSFPNMAEKRVIRAGKLIGSILWTDGYRRIDIKE
jgi:hypothetical protein